MDPAASLVLFGFTIILHLAEGQRSIVGNFSCDKSDELVSRTASSGSVYSPCYNEPGTFYPDELTAGKKLVNITHDDARVVGYQLTIRDFQIAESDRLYIGSSTEEATDNHVRAVRNVTLQYMSISDGKIIVTDEASQTNTTLDFNGTYLLEGYTTVILDFYTVVDTTGGRGFLIEYEADINQCLSVGADSYCKNNGSCTKTGFNMEECNCTGTGYNGTTCEEDIDECAASVDPCGVTGTCANRVGSYNCTCEQGYEGGIDGPCDDIDECAATDDTCEGTGNCTNRVGSYNCTCAPGYEGGIGGPCTDTDECAATENPCNVTGNCTNGIGSYNCTCESGYTGGVGGPCTDIDECVMDPNPCDDTGVCNNTEGSFFCTCAAGYTGGAGDSCVDIDECVGTNPCGDTGNCTNRVGSYNCTCAPGYEGGVDGPCTDINECAAGQINDCVDNATCANTVGSHNCTCDTGYTGDGKVNCTDIDECTLGSNDCDVDDEASCANTDGSFTCTCKAGYTGDGIACEDIDECTTSAHNCDDNATCSNNAGSFDCACKIGYTGNGTSCEDINECAAGQTNDCVNNATCNNTAGSHDCTCDEGYSGDGKVNCQDVDECFAGTDNCDAEEEATCTNNDGSYTCACNNGYTGDGLTCDDIDECTTSTHDCDDNADCNNTAGSFNCACRTGYTGNGTHCEDIDECMDGSNNCHSAANCLNGNGSFACTCKDGYTGDGINCTDINECDDALHDCTDGETTCNNVPGTFQCLCNFPTFRPPVVGEGCDYYCDHNSTCLANRNGFIDVPVNWTGETLYPTFDETFFNFTQPENGTGIRFTFLQFNTELMDDFLLFYPGNIRDINSEIVALSGTKDGLYNVKKRIFGSQNIQANTSSITAYMNQSNTDPTLTLSSGFINLAFTSDRLNASTGFVIMFEYDPNDCDTAMCESANTYNCIDETFAYKCNCTDGYEGTDCDMDINECNHTSIPNPCDVNATCSNTDGSYNCTCNEFYTGTGTTCQPHLVLSDYSVTEDVNALSINFGITSAWRSADYIAYFVVNITTEGNTLTYNVSLSDLTGSGFKVGGLNAYTAYDVKVELVGGPLFNTTVFDNNLGTRTFTTKEGPAGTPKNLGVGTGTRDRVTITWEKPDEIGFGAVTSYQLCYQPAADTKTQQVAALRGVTTQPTCIILDDTYTSYVWVGLPSYLDLVFHIRANTSAGAGNYTTTVASYTGTKCTPWTEYENREYCPYHQGLLESEGFPQDTENPVIEVLLQQWSYNLTDLTSYTGWRPTFVYFSTFPQESALDFGYGDIDITDHDIEKANRVKSYSGTTPSAEAGFNFTGQSILWFAFISDRVRKQSGFQVEIEVDRNNCDSGPCLNSGTCEDELYDYTCTCTPEWTDKSCETPRVQPAVMCTPGKRDLEINFTIPADRGNDETIIGGYHVDLMPADSTPSSMMKSIEMTREASFSGLKPYTNYTIMVTVHSSVRNAVLVQGSVVCETLEDAPTAPQNVTVTAESQTLDVTWEKPASPNGVVSYNVTVTSTDHDVYGDTEHKMTESVSDVLTYKFEGLSVYRTYNVVVTAITSGGSTAATAVSARTNPGPARSITGNVTVLPDNTARVEWEFPAGSGFPGPATITIKATSLGHNPAATTVNPGPTYLDTGSPYIFTGLEGGLSYNITVTASTGVADDTSFTVTDVNTNETAPGRPASFAYERNTSVFTWKMPTFLDRNGVITGYVLSTKDTVPGFSSPMSFDATTFSYQLNALPAFTKYEFALQAVNSAGNGIEFPLEITTKEIIPNPITNITADSVTANSITISWTAQSPAVGETTYDIVYASGTTASTTASTANTTITINNLTPYTDYAISVTAKTNAGSAAPYNKTIRTAEDVPGPVQNLVLSFVENNYQISVSWEAPATSNGIITRYNVAWTPGTGSPNTTAASVGASVTSYKIASAVSSQTAYTVVVTAYTSIGAGDAETKDLVTPKIVPVEPTELQATEVTKDSVTVTAAEPWNAMFVTVTGYVVKTEQDKTDCVAKGDDTCLEVVDKTATLPYTKTGLMNYRNYTITVAAESAGGIGKYSEPVKISTLAGAPGTPVVHSIIAVPGGFDVLLNSSRPYTGPANYTATATKDGQTVSETVFSGDQIDLIKVELRGLDGDATYDIAGSAQNGEGSSLATTATPAPSSPGQPTADVAASAEGVFTITITRITSATSYVVSYVETGCTNCTATTVDISPAASGATTYTISNLDAYKNYSVSVYAKSAVGDGLPTTQIQRTQAGTPALINTTASLPNPSGDTSGIQPAFAVKLTDLCAEKASIFDETSGPVVKIAYFVQQQPSTASVSDATFNVFYNDVSGQSPKPTYLSYTSNCVAASARRKKRQTVNNDVTIGSESSCPSGSSQCNGQLDPSTRYRFVACGQNENDRYVCLAPTSEYTTDPAPVANALSAGEIAAIVICSILLLILIILIVVYCVKRKRSRQGKASISKKGSDNPNFEEMGGQQHRYKVDPAAEPTTEYTTSDPKA